MLNTCSFRLVLRSSLPSDGLRRAADADPPKPSPRRNRLAHGCLAFLPRASRTEDRPAALLYGRMRMIVFLHRRQDRHRREELRNRSPPLTRHALNAAPRPLPFGVTVAAVIRVYCPKEFAPSAGDHRRLQHAACESTTCERASGDRGVPALGRLGRGPSNFRGVAKPGEIPRRHRGGHRTAGTARFADPARLNHAVPAQWRGREWARLGLNQGPLACEVGAKRCVRLRMASFHGF